MPCESKTQSFKLCQCAYKWRCRCLIPREKKPPPPFDTGRERDTIIGMHPKFYIGSPDSPVLGTYDPAPAKCKPLATSWDRELETAEFSATMGGRLAGTYGYQMNLLKTGRGPGTHEILQWPENVLDKPCKSIRRDIGFGTCPLFKPAFESTTPGPGEWILMYCIYCRSFDTFH
ncbi:uncharacterized protein LOC143375380 [Andrena cerasifolii]|uniref:uncharacterized protein LOC143375380 n=1 Tax=Andrena cerasifolii TaxID=2819439 RepID=UPI0040376473